MPECSAVAATNKGVPARRPDYRYAVGWRCVGGKET